jgi:hypothetical protein
MTMTWFIPVGIVIGAVGTQTAIKSRRSQKDRTWWLLLLLAWLPVACWLLAQFILQE